MLMGRIITRIPNITKRNQRRLRNRFSFRSLPLSLLFFAAIAQALISVVTVILTAQGMVVPIKVTVIALAVFPGLWLSREFDKEDMALIGHFLPARIGAENHKDGRGR